MLNKLIYEHRLILAPYLKALENASGDEALQQIQHLELLLDQNSEQRETLTKLMAQGYIDQILYNQETNALLLQAETYRSDIEAITICMTGDSAKVKSIVWRCISRFDYGKKYCHDSPSVDEQQLQQAILRAINSIMSEKPALVRQVTENLQVVIHPIRSGEFSVAEIDHQLEALAQDFDVAFATAATGNAADYSERFKMILTQQTELKAKRAELEQRQAEDAELTNHMELAADTLEQAGTAIIEWDEHYIRALVESVRILSKDEILVRLKSGIEKGRVFAEILFWLHLITLFFGSGVLYSKDNNS